MLIGGGFKGLTCRRPGVEGYTPCPAPSLYKFFGRDGKRWPHECRREYCCYWVSPQSEDESRGRDNEDCLWKPGSATTHTHTHTRQMSIRGDERAIAFEIPKLNSPSQVTQITQVANCPLGNEADARALTAAKVESHWVSSKPRYTSGCADTRNSNPPEHDNAPKHTIVAIPRQSDRGGAVLTPSVIARSGKHCDWVRDRLSGALLLVSGSDELIKSGCPR
jgi:hypothetical protein